MALMAWNPYRDLSSIQDHLNRMLGETGRREECLMGNWVPPVDILDEDDRIVMTFEVPGIERKDLDVEIHDGTLSVRGNRELEHPDQRDSYRRVERSYGAFCRTFKLPERVAVDRIEASVKDGLLMLVLPKTEESKPRKVSVDVK